MSKRRLVITAVPAGSSQSEVARTYGVSQGWISRLLARYRAEGDAAFEPRSRAPGSRPGATRPRPSSSSWSCARASPRPAWTPARTPSAGTCVTAHPQVTGPTVRDTFREAVAIHGIPASTLTDNGMVFTTRLAGGRGGRNAFEHELRRLGVQQKNSRPNHPTTCGKVERFQQTLKRWLRAQPGQPTTLAELQTLLDAFRNQYNHHRPHRSLPHRATPATTYHARPKATLATDRTADTHDRVRTDRIDTTGVVTLRVNGRLHHIGIGRTHARTHVLLLIQDLHVRIINATTGELLRDLVLDPTRDYQPTGRPPSPTPGQQ